MRSASQLVQYPFAFYSQIYPEVEKQNEAFKIQVSLDKAGVNIPMVYSEMSNLYPEL